MRLECWVLFGLLLSCNSKEPGGSGRAPSAEGSGLKRIEQPEPLPDVAASWKPTLRVEQGRCWARLKELHRADLEATRVEFWTRNPAWASFKPKMAQVDLFTGYLEYIESPRANDPHFDDIEPVEISDEAYQNRCLAPLRANADLFGLTAVELDALEWKPGSFDGTLRDRERPPALARIPCQDEAGRLAAAGRPCWMIELTFLRDATVASVRVSRRGPPVEMCTTPEISAYQVTSDIDARLQARNKPGEFVEPVGEPSLVLQATAGGLLNDTWTRTWRLTWTVPVGERRFFLDAVSGKTVSYEESLGIERDIEARRALPDGLW